jgi:hypothetical protein
VLFPDPLGPVMATNCPPGTRRLTSRTAVIACGPLP